MNEFLKLLDPKTSSQIFLRLCISSSPIEIKITPSSFNKDLDTLNDKDFQSECKNILEEYAIGGLEYLCESLFGFKWNGIKLDEIYDEYDLDLMSFIKK